MLRWFTCGSDVIAGRLNGGRGVARSQSATEHKRPIVVFGSVSGQKITGPLVDALNSASDWKTIPTAVDSTLAPDMIVACGAGLGLARRIHGETGLRPSQFVPPLNVLGKIHFSIA